MPTEDLPQGAGRRFVPGTAGATDALGVWVAGDATGLTAQVGAAAAAGAFAAGWPACPADAVPVAVLSSARARSGPVPEPGP